MLGTYTQLSAFLPDLVQKRNGSFLPLNPRFQGNQPFGELRFFTDFLNMKRLMGLTHLTDADSVSTKKGGGALSHKA